MPDRKGLLVVVSGPAGSGKTTLVNRFISEDHNTRRAITATTRKPRPDEQDGVDYYFLDEGEFKRRVEAGEFVEHTIFNSHHYGTLHRELNDNLARGGVVFLVIEVEGAEAIKSFFPAAAFIFIIPPTPEALRKRLEIRGTESQKDIEERLTIAKKEMQHLGEYDYLIINADPVLATLDLKAVIRAARRSRIIGGERERWIRGDFADWGKDKHRG